MKKLYLCEIETVDYINNTKLEILKETKKTIRSNERKFRVHRFMYKI